MMTLGNRTSLSFFEVVFDYDEGHYETLPPSADTQEFVQANIMGTREWPVRRDPFSAFRAGFEVRTYRLCRRVLMFHHFPEELGVNDYLVRSTDFNYRETPIASFITSATQSGYIHQNNGRYLMIFADPIALQRKMMIVANIRDLYHPCGFARVTNECTGSQSNGILHYPFCILNSFSK